MDFTEAVTRLYDRMNDAVAEAEQNGLPLTDIAEELRHVALELEGSHYSPNAGTDFRNLMASRKGSGGAPDRGGGR